MKRLYLYRLYKHSRPAFMFAVLFISFYTVSFYKKMDMVFFPYTGMYAVDFTKSSKATTYAMKIDGIPVKITHQPYWKKDLLETSLNAYCRYFKNNSKVFLNDYLEYKFSSKTVRDFLNVHLTPGIKDIAGWPAWYVRAAGYKAPKGASVTLIQYNFLFEKNDAKLIDSVLIYVTTL